MFRFITKKSIPNHNRNAYITQESSVNFEFKCVRLLQTLASESKSNTCNSKNQDNPTVSYLTNKCGLPLDSAISVSKKVTISSTQKADSVLQLFKSYDFTQTQITGLISKYPPILTYNANEILKPKLEYFESLGFPKSELPKMFSLNRFLLHSLSKKIIPTVDFLKSVLHSNQNVVTALKKFSCNDFGYCKGNTELACSVSILRARGMPDSNISKMLMEHPKTLMTRRDMFEDTVRKVEEMGLCSKSLAYIRALQAMTSISNSLWEKKVGIYKSYGWSDMDIIAAFKIQPLFIVCSEKKIRILMDFCLNKLGWKYTDVVKYPNLFLLSMEKRIIPWCSVLQILRSKDLIGSDLSTTAALSLSRTNFEKKFVTKYQEIIPEIVSVYQREAPQFDTITGFKNFQKVGNTRDQ